MPNAAMHSGGTNQSEPRTKVSVARQIQIYHDQVSFIEVENIENQI